MFNSIKLDESSNKLIIKYDAENTDDSQNNIEDPDTVEINLTDYSYRIYCGKANGQMYYIGSPIYSTEKIVNGFGDGTVKKDFYGKFHTQTSGWAGSSSNHFFINEKNQLCYVQEVENLDVNILAEDVSLIYFGSDGSIHAITGRNFKLLKENPYVVYNN